MKAPFLIVFKVLFHDENMNIIFFVWPIFFALNSADKSHFLVRKKDNFFRVKKSKF